MRVDCFVIGIDWLVINKWCWELNLYFIEVIFGIINWLVWLILLFWELRNLFY